MRVKDRQVVPGAVASAGSVLKREAPAQSLSPPVRATPRYRVLIVQQDLTLLRSIAENLRLAGLEWEGIADGELALQAFGQRVPHLVLLDAQLPGKSGLEVCSAIREQSQVPIILLMEQIPTCEQVRCLRLGADDFVVKPVVPELLAARVLAHLRRVYQYNAPQAAVDSTGRRAPGSQAAPHSTVTIPVNWATCHTCRYMGPRGLFPTRLAASGREKVLVCPHCGAAAEKGRA